MRFSLTGHALRIGLGILLLGMPACSATGLQQGTDPAHAGAQVSRDLSYHEGDPKRVLDVHHPRAEGPRPAIILVHGGSWARGDRSRMERVARKAAERGYVAVNIEYRLAPDDRYPAQVVDVLDAVCWVRENAEDLGVDPGRIALWGYSAGGHLSLLAAARPDLASDQGGCAGAAAEVQACVSGAGPTDLRPLGRARAVRAFLGGSPEEIPQVYAEASPLLAAGAHSPPTFLYHGRGDWIVSVDQSRRMRDALDSAGVTVELFEIDGGHVSAARFADEPIDRALDFLDQSLPGS